MILLHIAVRRDARPNGVTLMLLGAAYAMLGNDAEALATWRCVLAILTSSLLLAWGRATD